MTLTVETGCDIEPAPAAELRVYRSPMVEGCWVARCEVCPQGWLSFARPERAMARAAGLAHMARSHGGQWSGVVDEEDL